MGGTVMETGRGGVAVTGRRSRGRAAQAAGEETGELIPSADSISRSGSAEGLALREHMSGALHAGADAGTVVGISRTAGSANESEAGGAASILELTTTTTTTPPPDGSLGAGAGAGADDQQEEDRQGQGHLG